MSSSEDVLTLTIRHRRRLWTATFDVVRGVPLGRLLRRGPSQVSSRCSCSPTTKPQHKAYIIRCIIMMKLLQYHIHRMLPDYRTYGSRTSNKMYHKPSGSQAPRGAGNANTHIRPEDASAITWNASDDQSKCFSTRDISCADTSTYGALLASLTSYTRCTSHRDAATSEIMDCCRPRNAGSSGYQTVYEIMYGADGSPLCVATGMAARSSSGRGIVGEDVPVETPCSLGRVHVGNRRTRWRVLGWILWHDGAFRCCFSSSTGSEARLIFGTLFVSSRDTFSTPSLREAQCTIGFVGRTSAAAVCLLTILFPQVFLGDVWLRSSIG